MKPFHFSLQPIRVLREQKEQAAQQQYVQTLRVCEAAAARVRLAGEALAACWSSLGEELAAGAEATEVLRTRAWCNVLELRLKEQTGALEQARLEVDAVWREMLLATRDREAIDHFHDRQRAGYDLAVQRAEQKELDEVALRRAAAGGVFRVPLHAAVRGARSAGRGESPAGNGGRVVPSGVVDSQIS